MKIINSLLLIALISITCSIPFKAQISLANSLQVGRDQVPQTWECVGCTLQNKPLQSYMIQQKQKSVKCSLSVYQQYTVLAFRYTNTIKNVGQDLLWAIQVNDQNAPTGCKVQKQMDNMWNSIRNDVITDLAKKNKTSRLIITGISLGGALSVLSFVDIKDSGLFKNIEIITFGAPRVGNKNWAAWFDTQTTSTRYFIENDPIAVLPRCLTLLCNYGQTGIAYKCNKQKKQCKCQKGGQQDKFNLSRFVNDLSNSLIQINQQEVQLQGIVDHVTGYKTIYQWQQIGC